MAVNVLKLTWTPVDTVAVACQRVSKRKKSVGGVWDTTGFINVSTSINASCIAMDIATLFATVDYNNVYEFKVENKCETDALMINDNGIQEGILFKCITPVINVTNQFITVNVPILNTDITKIKYTVKKQSDSSTVATQIVVRDHNNSSHVFTLTEETAYFILVEMYANINGVEIISSHVDYMGTFCGGDVTGYQATTGVGAYTCTVYMNTTSSPITSTYTNCDGDLVTGAVLNPGQTICTRDGETAPTGSLTLMDEECL